MPTKPNPGSMLEKETKENKVMLIAAAIITLIVALCVFAFDTDLKAFADRAGTLLKILGGICFAGSWYVLYWGAKNEADGKAMLGWIILFAAAILVSCGFNFDYFGIK